MCSIMASGGHESDDWPNLVNSLTSPQIVHFHKYCQPDHLSSISIRLHELVCSGLDSLKNSDSVNVVVKISISPTPGKSKILRSSSKVEDDGSASFAFHHQAADLGMSTADMRGRLYAQGYSPVIAFEVSISSKTYLGKGEIYLPGIFSLLDDDIVTLPIQISGENPGFEQASILLDVKCNQPAKIMKKRKPQSITLWTYGLTNKVLKNGSLEASLSCTDENGRDTQQVQDIKINKKATEFENYFQITSIWPEGDVLTIRILDDKEEECGHVMIPVSAIASGSLTERMAHRVWQGKGKDLTTQDNYLVCSVEAIDAEDVCVDFGIRKAPPEEHDDSSPEFDEEAGNNFGATATGGSPELLNSLGGRFLGCVQGFTSEEASVMSGKQRYIAEVCLLPTEGSAQSPWAEQTQACAPHGTSSRNGVEWGKSFELPIAYALQQRYALHLTIQLFEESSKGGKKRCLGESCFDIVSLVSVRDNEIMTFFLPVFTPDSAKRIPSERKEIGKFVVAVQFISEKVFATNDNIPASTMGTTTNLLGKTKMNFSRTNFSAISDTQGYPTPGKSPGARSVATTVGQYQSRTQLKKTDGAGSINMSHSEVANAASEFWQALMADELKESAIPLFMQFNPVFDAASVLSRFGDNLSLVVDSMAESFETNFTYDDFEDTLIAEEDAAFSINTLARETAVALNVCFGRNGSACCECWIVLSKASLTMGLPIQLNIPLRDPHGLKVAVLRLGAHTSYPKIKTNTSSESLRVTFVDGYISDPTWANPLELYFECSMVAHKNYKGDVSKVPKGRTSWVGGGSSRKSKEVSISSMQCSIDLPCDAVPEEYLKRVPSAAPTWSLTIVGRDASRPGAPAVVTGHVNLAWSLLTKNKTLHERFMLRNSVTGKSLPVSIMIEKIMKGSGGLDSGSDGYEGVGSALLWMYGAQFPREDAPSSIDNVDVSVRWSKGNELSGQPFGGQGEVEDNNDGLLSAMFAKVSSIQQTRGDGSRPLITSVPLPGGFADLKLSVRCGDKTFSTLIPALASVSMPGGSNVSDLPKHNVLLSADGLKQGRADMGASPRLQFSMMFVPYVVGKLLFTVNDARLDMLPGSWILQPGNKRIALRFSVGTLSNIFTNQYAVKEVFNAVPPGKSVARAAPNKSSNSLFGEQTEGKSVSKFRQSINKTVPVRGSGTSGVPLFSKPESVEIPINTFDVMNCPSAAGVEEPLDLQCSLLDVDALPSNAASSSTQMSYIRAVGSVSTAALYYQAMRAAIAQPPSPALSKGHGGCSQEVAVAIPLHHPGTGEQIGTINGSMKFCMYGGAEDVVDDIATHIEKAGDTVLSNSDNGAELGLKQAYTTADTDNSGGISKDELISVFLKIKSQTKKGKDSTVGLDENAIKSMLELINVLDGDDDNGDENILEVSADQFRGYLEEFFAKLDLDGDGTISWWEWRQVLYAASLIRSDIVVKFMDHLDPLIIGFLAAHNGLEAIRESDPSCNLPTTTADLNSHRMISWGDGTKRGEMDRLIDELRRKNADLEDALRNSGHGNDAEANARIRIAREEADAAKRQLDAERARSSRLQAEIDGIAGASNAVGKNRSELEDESKRARDKLAEQGLKSKERIALAHRQRKKKSHSINMIRKALLRWINRHRKKKLTEEDLDGLVNLLPSRAATRIQKMHRGNLGRKRAQKHWWAIAVIQNFCRKRKEIRVHRSQFADFVAEMRKASMKIQSAFRNVQIKRKGNQRKANLKSTEAERRAVLMSELSNRSKFSRAATKVQRSFRARLAWKDVMSRVMGTKVEQVDVIPADQPLLSDALRYWIRLPSEKNDGEYRQGFVNNVDIERKALSVVFENSSNMAEEVIAFENPKITWFLETGVLVERDGVPKKMNLSSMYDVWLIAAEKPPLKDAEHYWIRINNNPASHLNLSPRSVDRQYYYGYVTSINTQSKSLGVFFDDFKKIIFVSYNLPSSDLRWYHEMLEPEAKKIIRELDRVEEDDTEEQLADLET